MDNEIAYYLNTGVLNIEELLNCTTHIELKEKFGQ